MQGIQSGDVTALQELLQEYWHPLVAYAIRLLSDRGEAEDVFQEAVLRVWNGRSEWARALP
jgi:DNA-directed RNA polymerase specialized sigma24 family protein